MSDKKDIYQLIPGRTYKVTREFIDYDEVHHPEGETWMFQKTNYNAYHSGLTLHVLMNNENKVYRFLDYPGEDRMIREFMQYVEEVKIDIPHQPS